MSLITLISLSMLSACSIFGGGAKREEANLTPADPGMATAAHSNHAEHSAPAAAHVNAATAPAAHAPATTSHAAGHHEVAGVAPEQALQWLKNGNMRFIKSRRRVDGLSNKDRVRLSAGQKPHAIVLSCADSRVPPEHVFDQALGEIFVVRVAGEALDSSVIGSIEYAVEHLGSRLIVIMGHDSCGAVKAAMGTKKGESAGSPALDKLVADIQPRLPATDGRAVASVNVAHESSLNAQGVAADLLKRSQIIGNAVVGGKIKVVSGIYYLKSGQVEFFN